MIGSFLTRGLVMVFGYAYPAYECFKTMEFNKPDIPQLSFWCQYWIIVATMTVCERIADSFVSWVPMYSEAKLAFYIYLWFPKTKGTTYVYESFFRPMLQQHQNEIDHYLLELKVRAGDTISSYVQKAAGYGQKRFFDILQYVASQSTPAPPRRQNSNKVTQPDAPLNQRSKAGKEQQTEQHPPSPPSGSSSGHEEGAGKDETLANAQKATPTKIVTETIKAQSSSEEQMQIINVQSSVDKCAKPSPPEETVAENAVRVTRARSRKIRPAA